MTQREQQILDWIRENPRISQQELAEKAGITRSSVAVHISNLAKKGYILGKGYVLSQEPERYVVGIGAVNIDLMGRSREKLVMEDSNPGFISMSVGGVTHNICENASRLGAGVNLISVTGDDIYGEKIRRECVAAGIDVSHFLILEGESSSTYLSLHDSNGEMALAMSDMRVLQKLSVDFLRKQHSLLRGAAAIVMDGGLPQEVLDYVRESYGEDIPIFADPVSTAYARKFTGDLHGYHTVKPNLLETEIMAGRKIENDGDLSAACEALLDRGAERVVVSLGRRGCRCYQKSGPAYAAWGPPMDRIVNATGAGDAFLGALLTAHLQDTPVEEALRFATAASRMAISHQATIHPGISARAVREIMDRDGLRCEKL